MRFKVYNVNYLRVVEDIKALFKHEIPVMFNYFTFFLNF